MTDWPAFRRSGDSPMTVCIDCGHPAKLGPRCFECYHVYRAERKARPDTLPPPPPEPESLPFCPSCGALRDVVAFRGVTKCAECWRNAA